MTIASVSALIDVAKLSDYAASKWAAMGFDESLRAELRNSAPALRTTVVCPYSQENVQTRTWRRRRLAGRGNRESRA